MYIKFVFCFMFLLKIGLSSFVNLQVQVIFSERHSAFLFWTSPPKTNGPILTKYGTKHLEAKRN